MDVIFALDDEQAKKKGEFFRAVHRIPTIIVSSRATRSGHTLLSPTTMADGPTNRTDDKIAA